MLSLCETCGRDTCRSFLNSDLSCRYNAATDMIQVKYNDVWTDWIGTGIQSPYALIPPMTNYGAPHGTVRASEEYTGRAAYQAFNGTNPDLTNGGTFWSPVNHTSGQWLSYMYENPVIIKRYQLYTGATLTFKLQRHDGVQWVDVETRTANGNSGNSFVHNAYELATEITAYGIRLYVTNPTGIIVFAGVQTYGRKGVPV